MTTQQDAIEAGVSAHCLDTYGIEWEDMSDAGKRSCRQEVAAAITAAAPILQAQAWDEGYDSGHAVGYGVAEFEQENPYTTP